MHHRTGCGESVRDWHPKDTSQTKEDRTFWDHLNGRELNGHEVHKEGQTEVKRLNKMHVFEPKWNTREERVQFRWVETLKTQWDSFWWQ